MLGLKTISKDVVKSDNFCDLDLSAQALYFHLLMNADENGVIDNPFAVARYIACEPARVHELIDNSFLVMIGDEYEYLLKVNREHWEKHTGGDMGSFLEVRELLNDNEEGSVDLSQRDECLQKR